MKLLIPNIRKISREFDIHYTPENPVTSDDRLADGPFNAATEFIVRTGVYCDNINRVIQFEREDIVQAVENLPISTSLLKREQVNDFIIQFLEKYESQIETAPTGSSY
jgi:hypothetical protein